MLGFPWGNSQYIVRVRPVEAWNGVKDPLHGSGLLPSPRPADPPWSQLMTTHRWAPHSGYTCKASAGLLASHQHACWPGLKGANGEQAGPPLFQDPQVWVQEEGLWTPTPTRLGSPTQLHPSLGCRSSSRGQGWHSRCWLSTPQERK